MALAVVAQPGRASVPSRVILSGDEAEDQKVAGSNPANGIFFNIILHNLFGDSLPQPPKLKNPEEWLSEVNGVSNPFEKLKLVLTAIESSDKYLDSNSSKGVGTPDNQWGAYTKLGKMPAQLLQKGAGKNLTIEQRLELFDRLDFIRENSRETPTDITLNAISLLSTGASWSGSEKLQEKVLPLMVLELTQHGAGLETESTRKMAKNYLDFAFKGESIGLFSKEALEGARAGLKKDIKNQEIKKSFYLGEPKSPLNDNNIKNCQERIDTRENYRKAIDSELERKGNIAQKRQPAGF